MIEGRVPSLRELGTDLERITLRQRIATLAMPFLCVALYSAFAARGFWPAAVVTLMYLSFVTYASVSHDLVHGTLRLPGWLNDLLLSLVELLALRSGHAYRLAHLYHHARFPQEDDIEGAASRMSFLRALLEGPLFHPRLWLWAMRRGGRERWLIATEGLLCVLLLGVAVALWRVSPMFPVYAALMIMGSWVYPLATSYIVHDPREKDELFQTRAFRGTVASVISFQHLYHLEHHLFPSVPHQNWPRLAKRLDPYLEKAGVRPIKLGF